MSPARDRSEDLLNQAAKALDTVEQQLGPNLTKAEQGLTKAVTKLGSADDEDHAIQLWVVYKISRSTPYILKHTFQTLKIFLFSSLPTLGQFSLGDEVDKADRVNATVKSTESIMSQLGNDLVTSKVWAQTLPKQADDAQKMMSNVENLRKLMNSTVLFSSLIEAVRNTQETVTNVFL